MLLAPGVLGALWQRVVNIGQEGQRAQAPSSKDPEPQSEHRLLKRRTTTAPILGVVSVTSWDEAGPRSTSPEQSLVPCGVWRRNPMITRPAFRSLHLNRHRLSFDRLGKGGDAFFQLLDSAQEAPLLEMSSMIWKLRPPEHSLHYPPSRKAPMNQDPKSM